MVGGASIIAKVTRDRVIKDWVYPETTLGPQGKDIGKAFGSGYPGDEQCVSFLGRCNAACGPVFGFPSLVRHSWSTSVQFLDKVHIYMYVYVYCMLPR